MRSAVFSLIIHGWLKGRRRALISLTSQKTIIASKDKGRLFYGEISHTTLKLFLTLLFTVALRGRS